ncbi:nucleotidyl transferase AbiEii/AbiGii toxin family protein [Dokdonella immobilis]|uniref:Nucleotidyl transferase AbiEii toxin, Type IV TA system n=1 Tax=Dokdonella immobilis TaxID=578942 RepID=A0A1I4Y166_9GAMM|nr:nucleotidyl transferase AbiEii/AbiGii toxin family protein [Dokdonella immobilis]SFN31824.1 Nucleotidyl transferase AbiEii toxin, Type IV TA system [Dokdonella immobilis]
MFDRPHHQRIASVLSSLDGELLRTFQCWFGGGTAIALMFGEYRESVDIDFLVSDAAGYRELRQRLRGARDLSALTRADVRPIDCERDMRADQYGIRTVLDVQGTPIKFEIVREARIAFEASRRTQRVCGISTLSRQDLAACKLLANADRWRDDSVFARDVIDLAMLDLPPRALRPALVKAIASYGVSVVADLQLALASLRERPERLHRCLQALSITLPAAALQQKLRSLARRVASAAEGMV